jgi:hypothetical protein
MQSNYMTEFPDFDYTITMPDGWQDVSWHNDVCPSFEKTFGNVTYKIFCDFANPQRREVDGEQFIVSVYIEDEVNFECIGQFETLEEALNLINKETA